MAIMIMICQGEDDVSGAGRQRHGSQIRSVRRGVYIVQC